MGGKVLIIDDDPALPRPMLMAFQAARFWTLAARNGRSGNSKGRTHRADLLVTNIVIPDIEGIGAIGAIKGATYPPKVIAIASAGRGRGGRLSRLGADGVLAKPLRMAELLKISRSAIATDPIHRTSKIEG